MQHLLRRKVVLALAALFFVFLGSSNAQTSRGNYNFLGFEQKPYFFGITLGYNTSDYRVYYSKNFILNDSFLTANSVTGPGFNLGIVSNLKIGDYFDFRFLPTLSFAERNLQYKSVSGGELFQRKVESVFVEFPFHVRYKSAPYNDKRLFVIAGVKYAFDVASDSKSRQADELVKISPTDFSIEYGAGVQFFLPYFIFSPEFKITQGLGNVLLYDDSLEQSNVLEKILSRTFTISFHFEG
ncbi:MAG: porin family protein [Saprospiraceae bacterium]